MKKKSKKQYRPISGQTWYEKLLDRITREENLRWSPILIYGYSAVLFFAIFLLSNVMELYDLADIFFHLWYALFPMVVVFAMINPICGLWEFRAERKLQKPICQYLEKHSRGTYDELVTHCMPLKLHLGIDRAIENLLQQRALIEEPDGSFRLPNENDRQAWRDAYAAEFGVKVSLEELKKIFDPDLNEWDESLVIEFSLHGRDGEMGWWKEDSHDVFWLMIDSNTRLDFASFHEMAEARVFDGQSLKEVCGDIILTDINHWYASAWMEEVF